MQGDFPGAAIAVVFVFLYSLKLLLLLRGERSASTVVFYVAALGLGVSWDYLFIEDWDSPDLDPATHWIGGPLLFLTLPTASFVADCIRRPSVTLFLYRSLIEVMLFPVWFLAVVWTALALGWISL